MIFSNVRLEKDLVIFLFINLCIRGNMCIYNKLSKIKHDFQLTIWTWSSELIHHEKIDLYLYEYRHFTNYKFKACK
jgi:hypothetical protein